MKPNAPVNDYYLDATNYTEYKQQVITDPEGNVTLGDWIIIICERPIKDYANKLYLISKHVQDIQSSIGNNEYTSSVIVSINQLIEEKTPIIQNFEIFGNPIKNIVNIDSFKQIDLRLVDFQYQPVLLMGLMLITIKVKPCENPKKKLH